MTPDVLLDALRRAGATIDDEAQQPTAAITKADLLDKGLIGPNSAEKRAELLKKLDLPQRLTPNAMLETLNLFLSREEFDKL